MLGHTLIVPDNEDRVEFVEQKPFVDDNGIYMPVDQYVPKGCCGSYRCVLTRELFVEAYKNWIEDGLLFERNKLLSRD